MTRQPILWFIGLLMLAALACNAFQPSAEPTASVPTLDLGSLPTGAATAVATEQAAVTATVTIGAADNTPPAAGQPTVTILVDSLNVRTGPGTGYDRVSFLSQGDSALIVGYDPASGWWKIQCPSNATGDQCWVSGGSQFTRAENTANVPVVPAPPTPTAVPSPTPSATPTRSPDPSGPIIAYVDGGDVWTRTLAPTGSSLVAGLPERLTERGDVTGVMISPDGRSIAYRGELSEGNYLALVNADGSGDRLLVATTDLPSSGPGLISLIGQAEWIDDEALAFNTSRVNRTGPGFAGNDDLWTVTLDGEMTEIYPAGQGGGAFDVAGQNVIMVSATEVIGGALDGSGREVLVTFPFINTASEYVYYAQPGWTADGSEAFVAVPDPDPFAFEDDAPPEVALWRIPAVGPATQVGELTGNVLFNPITWSGDGSRLAYVRQLTTPNAPTPRLLIARGDGTDVAPSSPEDEALAFLEWHPNSFNFLYRTSAGHAVGIVGSVDIPVAAPVGQTTTDAQWLTAVSYVFVQGAAPSWNVRVGNLSGDTAALFGITSSAPPSFDVWSR